MQNREETTNHKNYIKSFACMSLVHDETISRTLNSPLLKDYPSDRAGGPGGLNLLYDVLKYLNTRSLINSKIITKEKRHQYFPASSYVVLSRLVLEADRVVSGQGVS